MAEAPAGQKSAVRWLSPGEVRARWEPQAARLCLSICGGEELPDARAAMAFPVTAPDTFVDLCDAKGESVGMLRSLAELDAGSRGAVKAALEARYLIPKVLRVLELSELGPFVLRWRVQTDRGERTIHTESPREAIRYQTPDHLRLTDLAGNHYDFPSIAGLDPDSRRLLSSVL